MEEISREKANVRKLLINVAPNQSRARNTLTQNCGLRIMFCAHTF